MSQPIRPLVLRLGGSSGGRFAAIVVVASTGTAGTYAVSAGAGTAAGAWMGWPER